MLASNCNEKIAAGLYQRKSLPRVFHDLDARASCTHQRYYCTSQIFPISKDLSTLFFLSLVLAPAGAHLCLLSVLSPLILKGFTCNRSLIENEFLSQIHSLIVDRVNWVSSSYLCVYTIFCVKIFSVMCKMSN